ncbi:P-type conjugative transfer protein TrbG [Bryobacter aggregatus]|uniref:P-type conjugative transfer protein TrbG n=1 Tax=Bryobacter aggregatus TaxID=360054 RepID=UPI0006918597|nr:P-type conjugative transfer protein TrbG [Bryobacter aggregatus]
MKIILVCFVIVGGLIWGQQAPIELKRRPPDGVPLPEKYPFDQLIQSLDVPPSPPPANARASIGPGESTTRTELPKDFNPAREVALPKSAQEALAVGQAWMKEASPPAPGKDGRVLYTYGAGLPTVVCAPLRVCIIELEAGEHLVGEPHIGDAVRWTIAAASVGQGDGVTPLIVLKPKQVGLDTNLLLTTDRRAYYLRLISKPEEYLARVAFAYPEDELRKWKLHLAKEEQRLKAEREDASVSPVSSLENLYFEYRIESRNPHIRPVRVVDDGKKTFIQMTPEAANREAPVLVVIGADGAEMVNYRVKGEMYIVDRLFERGALILGVGKAAQRAEIIRGTYRGKLKPQKALDANFGKQGGSR